MSCENDTILTTPLGELSYTFSAPLMEELRGSSTWSRIKLHMCYLNVTTGLKAGADIPLTQAEMVIGRQSNCELPLPDHTISRRHAKIIQRSDGYYLEDLQSRNGTYLNGRRIVDPIRLNDRDQIQLYDVTLTFRDEEQAKAPLHKVPNSPRDPRALVC